MSELTTEQRAAKAYNSVMAHGLSLKNKLDIVFDEYQEFIKNKLGEEGYNKLGSKMIITKYNGALDMNVYFP